MPLPNPSHSSSTVSFRGSCPRLGDSFHGKGSASASALPPHKLPRRPRLNPPPPSSAQRPTSPPPPTYPTHRLFGSSSPRIPDITPPPPLPERPHYPGSTHRTIAPLLRSGQSRNMQRTHLVGTPRRAQGERVREGDGDGREQVLALLVELDEALPRLHRRRSRGGRWRGTDTRHGCGCLNTTYYAPEAPCP